MTEAVDTPSIPCGADGNPAWWTGIIYQIYPRSFADSNSNGIGDLTGITGQLNYLSGTLGIDAIWISPFFPSPMADFGYDVSDYVDVDPMFGSLSDFDDLIAEAHRLDLRVIIDWVPNHSSDQHAWFKESRSTRDNPKRDWYVWRDPAPDGGPPNNWLSIFGGIAWEFDDTTGQFYLHTFLKEQPELNWRNPEVETAMLDTLRFWLDRGVDGFRVDVAHYLMKDPAFRDNPINPSPRPVGKDRHDYDTQLHVYDNAHTDIHTVHRRIRSVIDDYGDRFSIGEIHEPDWDAWASYYGDDLDQLHMPYNFSLLWVPWTAEGFRSQIVAQEAALPTGAWPNHVFGNHDESRLATRFGTDRVRAAAVLLLTLRGTPTIYYGDELGLVDGVIGPGNEQDPWGKLYPDLNRDVCRTPMQWTPDPGMGFTNSTSRSWLPYATSDTSVETQIGDPNSTLSLYRTIIELRRVHTELALGAITMLTDNPANVLSYARTLEGAVSYVAINFTDSVQRFVFPCVVDQILTTHAHRETSFSEVTLAADEAIVVKPVRW
ncbi:MAG: alpha-amylase family glycosyl hydrolase [Actinomycetia bacterium]|nr:alpha-amylase family glycosyl hydrolase [Actinomycetes bacterium]